MTKAILRRHLMACAAESHPEKKSVSPLHEVQKTRDDGTDSLSPYAETSLQSWFDPLDMDFDPDHTVLSVHFPHVFFGQRFAKLFRPFFERAAHQIWGPELRIFYAPVSGIDAIWKGHTASDSSTKARNEHTSIETLSSQTGIGHCSETRPEEICLHTTRPSHIDFPLFSSSSNALPYGEEWTFDTLITNGKHKWALSLIREATRRTVLQATSPFSRKEEQPGILVLCGQHGTGKTHILRAMGNELFRTLSTKLLYISLSELEVLFSSASPLAIRQELADRQAILIDDFQYLSRIPELIGNNLSAEENGVCFQEELCLLIDRFMDQGKLLVVAGVGHPRDWNLHRALLSRLETGLWAELPEPDLDIRLRYVQQQVRQKRIPLLREQMMLLAQHCLDIRKLSGVIRQVISHRSLVGHDLTEQDLIDIVRQSGDRSPLTAQQIVSIVGEYCEISPRDILGEKRHPDLVQARQLAMYLCRELLGHSYPVIGRMFGGKDHSTVMHSVKKIKALQENDRIMHTMVTELTKVCRERHD